jgi:hypothetical protein
MWRVPLKTPSYWVIDGRKFSLIHTFSTHTVTHNDPALFINAAHAQKQPYCMYLR